LGARNFGAAAQYIEIKTIHIPGLQHSLHKIRFVLDHFKLWQFIVYPVTYIIFGKKYCSICAPATDDILL
jgi:hypothetical protein